MFTLKHTVFAEYLERREEINLSVNDIIASAGVQLVVPTKTTYINQTEITRPA